MILNIYGYNIILREWMGRRWIRTKVLDMVDMLFGRGEGMIIWEVDGHSKMLNM